MAMISRGYFQFVYTLKKPGNAVPERIKHRQRTLVRDINHGVLSTGMRGSFSRQCQCRHYTLRSSNIASLLPPALIDNHHPRRFGSPYEDGYYGINCGFILPLSPKLLLTTNTHVESISRSICPRALRLGCSMFSFHAIDLTGPRSVKFCVESKHSCPTTSTRLFTDSEHVADALRDMREICLSAGKGDEESELGSAGAEPDTPNTVAHEWSRFRQLEDSVFARPRL